MPTWRIFVCFAPCFVTALFGQARPTAPEQTRAEMIEQERLEKQRNGSSEGRTTAVERAIARATSERELPGSLLFSKNGFGIRTGNVRSGGGFAIGPRYYRRDLAGERVIWLNSLTASLSRYWAAETSLLLPRISGTPFDVQFGARHSDAPSMNYFGPGIDSQRHSKTNYRREDTIFKGGLGLPLWNRVLTAGFAGGVNLVNIGPGRGDSVSTDRVFSPQLTPGIRRQSPYLFTGPFVTFDLRDFPGDPHKGMLAEASYLYYPDYKTNQYSFGRFTGQLEGYIPFFNATRVIALRGRTEMSFVPGGNTVPFYLQPTMGGPDDLRGFDRYRFYDNNALILNAEYRFEVASALDMVFFVDSGSVYSRPGLVGFRNMEQSGGLGFRFKTRNQVFMRFDTGVSREGLHVWLQFSNAFSLLPRFR